MHIKNTKLLSAVNKTEKLGKELEIYKKYNEKFMQAITTQINENVILKNQIIGLCEEIRQLQEELIETRKQLKILDNELLCL